MALVELLATVPMPVLVALVIAFSILLSAAGVLWVRRRTPLEVLEANNEFQDLVGGGIGVFYAVLLAFVVFIVWDQHRETSRYVEGEANKLGDILRNAEGYPDPFGREVQQQAHDYARAVVAEWEEVGRGGEGIRAREAFDRLWLLYQRYDPRTARENALYAEGLDRLSELREQRRLRLLHVKQSVPGLLWFVLLVGGFVTVGSALFFGLRNLRAQVALTAMLAVIISLALLVVFAFDHPFITDIRVTPEAFVRQIEEAERFMSH